jgi:hypothetical protein
MPSPQRIIPVPYRKEPVSKLYVLGKPETPEIKV